MTGQIRLGCGTCDRNDFDFVSVLPNDWSDVSEVQSYEESISEVALNDKSRSPFDWQTHLGTCPRCQAGEN